MGRRQHVANCKRLASKMTVTWILLLLPPSPPSPPRDRKREKNERKSEGEGDIDGEGEGEKANAKTWRSYRLALNSHPPPTDSVAQVHSLKMCF